VVGLIKEKCVAEILSGLNAGQEFADVSSDFVFVHSNWAKLHSTAIGFDHRGYGRRFSLQDAHDNSSVTDRASRGQGQLREVTDTRRNSASRPVPGYCTNTTDRGEETDSGALRPACFLKNSGFWDDIACWLKLVFCLLSG
jgi:hypothetical protein